MNHIGIECTDDEVLYLWRVRIFHQKFTILWNPVASFNYCAPWDHDSDANEIWNNLKWDLSLFDFLVNNFESFRDVKISNKTSINIKFDPKSNDFVPNEINIMLKIIKV